MPLNVKTALRKASALAKKGDGAGAVRLYREILEQFPQNRQAQNGLAAIQQPGVSAGPAAAVLPRAQMMELVRLYQQGQAGEALRQGQILVSQYRHDPMLHNFLGVVLTGAGRPDNALAYYQQAVTLKPDYAEAWVNLGVACNDLGHYSDASKSFSQVTRIEPENAQAFCGLGAAFKELGKYNDAIASYNRAIQLKPDYADAFNNLGNIFERVSRREEALECFRRAVTLNARNADALCNLGHGLSDQREYREAIEAYRSALEIQPQMHNAQAGVAYLSAMLCDWAAVAAALDKLPSPKAGGDAVGPFAMLGLEDNPETQLARAQHYTRQNFKNLQPLPTLPPDGVVPEKLKIGYFSCEFHDHATMYLMIRMLELHDAESFEIHLFSYGPEMADVMATRARNSATVFHDVRNSGDREIAELARREGVHIAVDLKGYTQGGRPEIFAYRAAPVQMSYLGFPGATGIDAMDYVVADDLVIPTEQQKYYTEKVIYMPNSYQVNDDGRQISERTVSRDEAGLPASGLVFCCFNNSYKISPREFDIWMRLLLRVEGSVLWLLDANETAVGNLRREAECRGVAAERLVFAKRASLAEHLARHRLADLFLDTFTYNAHTTASDALWAGVPVVTRPGNGFAARVGASLVRAAGLPELITSSDEDYEQLALDLALNPQRLTELKNKLAANCETCPLFDTELFTRQIETAYKLAYQRYQEGEAPAVLRVASG